MELNERQQQIVTYLEQAGESAKAATIFAALTGEHAAGKRTIIRDLQHLISLGLVQEKGGGRSAAYVLSQQYRSVMPIDVDAYFAREAASRTVKPWFDDNVFAILSDTLFTKDELARLHVLDAQYKNAKSTLQRESPALVRREWERLVIELSWKSSEIEGNTYTLLETEALIKEHREASGKDKAEAKMILNHKAALDYVLSHPSFLEVVQSDKIQHIHGILTDGLDIALGFRNHPVGITGTPYRPPGNERAISGLMEKLTNSLSHIESVFVRAFVALIMIAYIQPFEDGNKRTSRIVANAILHSAGSAMLSYRTVDAVEYKKAMLLFYEQNNVSYIKRIFLDQFDFSVKNYFADEAKPKT